MNSTVSVIIPFYNNASWLTEAVESVLAQSYPADEIIVINDGSEEDISSFIEKYKEKVIYFYKKNGGPATARNFGIEKSSGDYIAFLDSDDIWLPNKLEIQIKLMDRYNAKWSHTSYELFDTENTEDNIINRISAKGFDGMIYPKMIISNSLATPTLVISGNLLRENPEFRFNNNMRFGQDQFLWVNIAPEHEILAIDETLVKVRMRGSNAALRARVQLRARALIWQVLLQDKEKFKVKEISNVVKIAFKLSSLGTYVLSIFEKLTKNKRILEFISRILYIIPWILFKWEFKILSKQGKKNGKRINT